MTAVAGKGGEYLTWNTSKDACRWTVERQIGDDGDGADVDVDVDVDVDEPTAGSTCGVDFVLDSLLLPDGELAFAGGRFALSLRDVQGSEGNAAAVDPFVEDASP